MIQLHDIDPIAFGLGPLQVHWYGIMYLLGFGFASAPVYGTAGLFFVGWC